VAANIFAASGASGGSAGVEKRARENVKMSLFGPNVKKLEQRRDADGLVKCLENKDPAVRKDAVEALSRLKDKATVGPLMAALADPGRDVRSSVLSALEAIDSDWRKHRSADLVAEEIVSELKSVDPAHRFAAATALEEFPVQKALPMLIDLLQHDSEEEIRSKSARALGELGDKRAVESLINALRNDKSAEARLNSAVALGKIRDRRAIPLLFNLVNRNVAPWDEALMVGIRALGEIGAVGELINLINEDMPGVERRAREELRRITGKEFEEPAAWSDWWKKTEASFQTPPKTGAWAQHPIVFGSPRKICERVFIDYGLSTLNAARLVAAAIESISKGPQLEQSLEAGLAVAGLSEPLGVLIERLAGWERTSAIMELGMVEKKLYREVKGQSR